MGVYVENMEKPVRCGACPFGETDYTNNTIRCTKAGIPSYKAYSWPDLVPHWCPIEELPREQFEAGRKAAQ